MKKCASFYKSKQDFIKIHHELKFTQCKHCLAIGCLILHGYLRGYHESGSKQDLVRGRRIYCSKRNRKKGCGKTFSLLKASLIKHYTTTASTITTFLNNLLDGYSKKEAFKKKDSIVSDTSIYRYYKRFDENIPKIRTLLLTIKPPPDEPGLKNPFLQTVKHLKDVFCDHECMIAAFQNTFNTSIF